MKWTEVLLEKAIDVSSIAFEADEALTALYTKIIEEAAATSIRIGKRLENGRFGDPYPDDRVKAAMEYYHEHTRAFGRSAAYACMYDGSKLLTNLVQEFMLREHGVDNDNDGQNDGVIVDGLYYPIGNIRVIIEKDNVPEGVGGHMMRQHRAGDFHAINGGVPESNKHFAGCKIYLDKASVKMWVETVDEAVHNLVYYAFNGEYADYYPGYYPDMLVHDVIPTFTHELDHLVYYTKSNKGSISMIGSGGRKGRRNYDIGFGTTPKENQRYYGSHVELQAFASGAAIRILRNEVLAIGKNWMTIRNDGINLTDSKVWNSIIDDLIEKIKHGDPLTPDIYVYQKDIRDAEPDKSSYQRVWRRFIRLVVDKLEQYKR